MRKAALIAILALVCAAGIAFAQEYPAKPVRLIVPFPPGGGNDTIARLLGQKLSPVLGQQVLVDNRPGAAGAIGAELAAKAAPDGYTLFLAGVATHGINPDLRKKLPYDAVIPVGSAPDEFDAHIRREIARWEKVIRAAKLTPD